MKREIIIVGILVVALLVIPFGAVMAETPQEKGWKIMKAIDEMPVVEKMTSETAFKIYDAQGKLLFTKKSRAAIFIENYKDPDNRLSRNISYFFAPADDKGNSALMTENPGDQEDDQWVYLKGLRKPKRVIGSDKSSSFMGSDFSNGDVSADDIDDSHYTWLGTETIEFKEKQIQVEKIASEFKSEKKKEDYGYSKTIDWVHPSSGLTFKSEMYDLNGQLAKTMTLFSFVVLKNRDGKRVFWNTGAEMKTVLKGTKTIMQMDNTKVEDETGKIDPDIFNISYLTRKWW